MRIVDLPQTELTYAIGDIHGSLDLLERAFALIRTHAGTRSFHIVCLGWILFRAESFDMAMAMLEGLTRAGPVVMLTPLLLGLIVAGLAMHWLPPRAVEGLAERLKTAPAITLGLLIGAAILLVEAVRPEGVAPFIYFQF